MNLDKQFVWGHQRRFNDFSNYFKKQFKQRVQKISVDAGFTCPNRDGSKSTGGCTYCNNKTFKPTYCELEVSITDQINKGIAFFQKKYPDIDYIAYFQAYTNTYAPLNDLKILYSEALMHPRVIGLSIATRPDCLNNELLDYLETLNRDYYITIELGVESCNNKSLKAINRGHTFEESERAINELSKRGINKGVHMILGLPGEGRDIILKQAEILSKLPVDNLKLHQLQIHKGTVMEKQYQEHPEMFELYHDVYDYIDLVVEYLELLNPEIVLERFISQAPRDLLIAPKWGIKNFEFVAKLDKRLKELDSWQGKNIKVLDC